MCLNSKLALVALIERTARREYARKKTYFVDLFVRVSNKRAVDMYHKLNYVVYRRIIGYYSGERDEDAFGKNTTLLSFSSTCRRVHLSFQTCAKRYREMSTRNR